jgi:hypothetical protein
MPYGLCCRSPLESRLSLSRGICRTPACMIYKCRSPDLGSSSSPANHRAHTHPAEEFHERDGCRASELNLHPHLPVSCASVRVRFCRLTTHVGHDVTQKKKKTNTSKPRRACVQFQKFSRRPTEPGHITPAPPPSPTAKKKKGSSETALLTRFRQSCGLHFRFWRPPKSPTNRCAKHVAHLTRVTLACERNDANRLRAEMKSLSPRFVRSFCFVGPCGCFLLLPLRSPSVVQSQLTTG